MPAPHPASNPGTPATTTSVGPSCESRGWTAQCRSVVKNNTGETVDVDIWYDGGLEAWAWCTQVPDGANATMKGHWYRYQTTAYHPGGSVVARSGLHGMSAFFKLVKIDGHFAFLASSEQEVDRLIYDRLELKALGGRCLGPVQILSSASGVLHCDTAGRLCFRKKEFFEKKKDKNTKGSIFELYEHGEGDYSLRSERGGFINLAPADEVEALEEAFIAQASTFNLLLIEKVGDKCAIKSRMSQRYLAACEDGLAKATVTSSARENFTITMEGAALPIFGTEAVQTPEEFWQGVKRSDPLPYRVIICTTSQETLYLALFYTDVYQIHIHVEDDDRVAAAHVKRMSADQRTMINLLDAKLILMEWRRKGVPFVGPNGRPLRLPNMCMLERDLREAAERLAASNNGMSSSVQRNVAASAALKNLGIPGVALLVAADLDKRLQIAGAITEVCFGIDWSHWWVGLPHDLIQGLPGSLDVIMKALVLIPGVGELALVVSSFLGVSAAVLKAVDQGNGVWIDFYLHLAPIPRPA